MDVPSYFDDFLAVIRPSAKQRVRMAEAHADLRSRLERDKKLSLILVSMFIQGSYRRHTGLLGTKKNQCDVDLVVVTSIPSTTPPAIALEMFRPFLEENYKGRYERQGRSWCINWDAEITLDLVPTSAPSQANTKFYRSFGNGFNLDDPVFDSARRRFKTKDPLLEAYLIEKKKGWQAEPLEIPDREANKWEKTHPLAQIEWTTEKNAKCDGNYINVVRAIKWWRRMMQPEPKYPKGYPLEHLVGACCPDGIGSIAEGVARSLSAIVDNYRATAMLGRKPVLKDHGVDYDVFKRVPAEDFVGFYNNAVSASFLATQARAADTRHKSVTLWKELFGDAFPEPPEEDKPTIEVASAGGYSTRSSSSTPSGGRFA